MKANRFTEQFPVVGTKQTKQLLIAVSEHPLVQDSQALVVRAAIDLLFGLSDGNLPGVEGEAALATTPEQIAALKETPQFQAAVDLVAGHLAGPNRLVTTSPEPAIH